MPLEVDIEKITLKNNSRANLIAMKNRLKIFKNFIILILMLCFSVAAEQTKFSKVLDGENYVFNYQWYSHDQIPLQMSFSLPQHSIFNRYRDFSAYQPNLANEYVNNALRKRIKQSPLNGVQLFFRKENNELLIDINGKDRQLVAQAYQDLAALKIELMQEYLTKKYYHQFTAANQVQAIKPDHGKIAIDSVADLKTLKAIILAKAKIKNIRMVTDFVLSFVQSIPYAPLESRITSSGAGFNPPLKLLFENQGDCDSKVTLTASLLRALMPRIKMALVFIDNHALIGINVTPRSNEQTIEYDNITYVLAEPTGPALLALGTIGAESEQAINNGHYTVEPFHNQYQATDDETDEIIDSD